MNASSRAQEQREQQIQDRIMTAMERGFTVQIARILHKASQASARAVETYGASANIEAVLSELPAVLEAVFVPHYTKTVDLFGQRILQAFKSHSGYQTKAEDVFSESMRLWIQRTSAEKVTRVSDTTKRQIRKALDEGFGAEMTGSEVAKSIMGKTGGGIARQRATVIARTETHMAANHASHEAAASTGIPMKRVWISAEDERTRDDHLAADAESHSEPVGMNEAFPVVNLDYPGDPAGDPATTINCRCAVGYITA